MPVIGRGERATRNAVYSYLGEPRGPTRVNEEQRVVHAQALSKTPVGHFVTCSRDGRINSFDIRVGEHVRRV